MYDMFIYTHNYCTHYYIYTIYICMFLLNSKDPKSCILLQPIMGIIAFLKININQLAHK